MGEVSLSRSVGRWQECSQLSRGRVAAIQIRNEAVLKADTEPECECCPLTTVQVCDADVGKARDAVIVCSSLTFAAELDRWSLVVEATASRPVYCLGLKSS